MLIKTYSYARAGLLGNPSDGYFGKTLSFAFRNFGVELIMYETPHLGFVPTEVDDDTFTCIDDLLDEIQLFGYYGGIRLLKAVTKMFVQYCGEQGIKLPERNFTVQYTCNIPRLVGLAGSSAICTAMLKALMQFYEVNILEEYAPTLCLRAERDELGIQCGFQDRVVQMYNGVMFMDFDRVSIDTQGHGKYTRLAADTLPQLYIAYDPKRAEISGVYHQKLRVLFEEKKPDILAAMSEFADLAQQGYDALIAGNPAKLHSLINANFDLRNRVFNVAEANRAMIQAARAVGCSAKFAGSGGAIVGTYDDETQFAVLSQAMSTIGCTTIKPQIT